MLQNIYLYFLAVFFMLVITASGARPGYTGQHVSVSGNSTLSTLEQALDQALGQEVQTVLPTPLSASRLAQVLGVLAPERANLILGYSEVSAGSSAESAPENATTNGTDKARILDVRVHSEAVRNRLRELGVLFTASSSRPYVLRLSDVEPTRTKALGPLQEMSGLQPVSTAGADVPVLTLSQFGNWTGVLSQGDWSATHTARSLDDVWLAVWKAYFNRGGIAVQGEAGVLVRVSGWLSSQGPSEFDRLMDAWTTEIGQKTLVEVKMEESGMTGVWRIQTKSKNALLRRLEDATKAQGLALDVR